MLCKSVANENLKYPSMPKPIPGTNATPSFSSNALEKAIESGLIVEQFTKR